MPTLPKCKPEVRKVNIPKEIFSIIVLMIQASAGLVVFGILLGLIMLSLDKLIL
jgi:hypothetical protein